jgi:hypothetical protein
LGVFRKALAKSPVVKRAAALQEQEQKSVSKHRTSRYWLDENVSFFPLFIKTLMIFEFSSKAILIFGFHRPVREVPQALQTQNATLERKIVRKSERKEDVLLVILSLTLHVFHCWQK